MKTEMMEIDLIIPYARNPRNNITAVDSVVASIKEFGFQQPIVLDKLHTIIVGHTRHLAARQLGLKKVPVVIADKLTEAQIKAYRIADNRVNQNATWDYDFLKLELEEIPDEMLFTTGFDKGELDFINKGWETELDIPDKDGENLDGILANIKVQLSQDEKDVATDSIKKALDELGIEYEVK